MGRSCEARGHPRHTRIQLAILAGARLKRRFVHSMNPKVSILQEARCAFIMTVLRVERRIRTSASWAYRRRGRPCR
jgi:hypothetical protein